jgi:hypothetical protein
MKKTIIFLACLLLAAPFAVAEEGSTTAAQEEAALQAQEQQRSRVQEQIDKEETPAYLQAMYQNQFRHENTQRIQNMIEEAQQKGLPTEPMQNKVHEGIAKKADEEAIVRAVEQVQNRYENAYRHAQTLFDEPEQVQSMGNRFAEANAAGLANEDAARIMVQLQNRTRNMNRAQAF